MKYYRVYVDGIDKTGKDTICSYITILSNHKYLVKPRGLISMMSYSEIYNRQYHYDLTQEKNSVNILLTVNYDDWKVRCKMSNEKDMKDNDYNFHVNVFEKYYTLLQSNSCKTLRYNTSVETPYQIAKNIIEYLDNLNDRSEHEK